MMNLTTPLEKKVPNELYSLLSPELVRDLEKHEQLRSFPHGSRLIQHGTLPDQLLILEVGSVEILMPSSRNPISLGRAGSGKVFGMRAVISGEAPEFDVTCLEPCQVRILPREAFIELLEKHPQLYFAVAKVLSADLKIADLVLRNYSRRCAQRTRSKIARPR